MTYTELIAHVRILIDQPNTVIWSDANIGALVNDSLRDIYQDIHRRCPKYLYKSASVATVASTYTTAVPSDCAMMDKIVNSSNETLPRLKTMQMDMAESSGEPEAYDIVGPNIFWFPKPNGAYTLTAYYSYMPANISGTTEPTLPYGYHDVVAWGAALKSRIIKDEQFREYTMIYQDKLSKLLRACMVDTLNEAPRINGAYHDFYLYD